MEKQPRLSVETSQPEYEHSIKKQLNMFGLILGIKSIIRFKINTDTLGLLLIPVNYWRNVEYDMVYRSLKFSKNDKVLDIGSPKLLSLYLAKKIDCEIYSTDLLPYFIKTYSFLRDLLNISKRNYHLQTQDGCKLDIPDNSFTKIYSISVLEHIPYNGDTLCMKEIYRVLKNDGEVAITVPFSEKSLNDYRKKKFYYSNTSITNENNEIFFQRRYSEKDIYERLIKPSKLKVVNVYYIGDKILTKNKYEFSDFLNKIPVGFIHLLCSGLFLTKPIENWRDLKKPLCAVIILKKYA